MVTAISDPSERAELLGYVGVAYGIGFAIGPYIGGLLSEISLQLAAWAAMLGSVTSIGLIVMFLPAMGAGAYLTLAWLQRVKNNALVQTAYLENMSQIISRVLHSSVI